MLTVKWFAPKNDSSPQSQELGEEIILKFLKKFQFAYKKIAILRLGDVNFTSDL